MNKTEIKLTKKQVEFLRSEKAVVKAPTEGPYRYHVHFSLTLGELLAMKNSLETNPTMVGSDVRDYLNNALEKAGVTF